jgi:asparagine synthase (glutamine-hydrolysing)
VKAVAGGILSPAVARRSKSGFGVPLDDWFRSPVLAPLLDRLRDTRHPAAAHFDRGVLATILGEHAAGRRDHGEVLWLLANVYVWHEVCTWTSSGLPTSPRQGSDS